jgi:hypothetical protein
MVITYIIQHSVSSDRLEKRDLQHLYSSRLFVHCHQTLQSVLKHESVELQNYSKDCFWNFLRNKMSKANLTKALVKAQSFHDINLTMQLIDMIMSYHNLVS